MTRHGRNATNSAVYTYHERKKDANASGYGSDKCRLGKDSLKGKDLDLLYSMVQFVKLLTITNLEGKIVILLNCTI